MSNPRRVLAVFLLAASAFAQDSGTVKLSSQSTLTNQIRSMYLTQGGKIRLSRQWIIRLTRGVTTCSTAYLVTS
jgi:hypothetical protein